MSSWQLIKSLDVVFLLVATNIISWLQFWLNNFKYFDVTFISAQVIGLYCKCFILISLTSFRVFTQLTEKKTDNCHMYFHKNWSDGVFNVDLMVREVALFYWILFRTKISSYKLTVCKLKQCQNLKTSEWDTNWNLLLGKGTKTGSLGSSTI